MNFKLSETNVEVKQSACHERGTKKNSESPIGFEPMTCQTPGGRPILGETNVNMSGRS